jgi:ubiquinone/menaquinone biosynthesis C-methylase UbiE
MAVLQRKVDFLGLGNVELSTSDAAKLDLPDDSVDVVVSNLGVNNFDNADIVLRECRRVLRPGGRMLISGSTSTRSSPTSLIARPWTAPWRCSRLPASLIPRCKRARSSCAMPTAPRCSGTTSSDSVSYRRGEQSCL